MDKSYIFETSVFIKRIPLLEKSTKKFCRKLFLMRKPKDLFLKKSYSVLAIDCHHFEYRKPHNFNRLLKYRPKNKLNSRIYPPLLRSFKSLSTKPKFETLNLKVYKTPRKKKRWKIYGVSIR